MVEWEALKVRPGKPRAVLHAVDALASNPAVLIAPQSRMASNVIMLEVLIHGGGEDDFQWMLENGLCFESDRDSLEWAANGFAELAEEDAE